jgi:hypothetical protein
VVMCRRSYKRGKIRAARPSTSPKSGVKKCYSLLHSKSDHEYPLIRFMHHPNCISLTFVNSTIVQKLFTTRCIQSKARLCGDCIRTRTYAMLSILGLPRFPSGKGNKCILPAHVDPTP